jgi:predicted ribosomally synthesized peptide with SipW-like signal peptide
MRLSRSKLIVVGTLGVAGLALIGAGAGASFTDAVQVTQTIKTGNLDLEITGVAFRGYDPASAGGLSGPVSVFGPGRSKSVSLGTSANNGSILDELYLVTVQNFGTLPATLSCDLSGSDTSQLAKDTTVVQAGDSVSNTEAAGTGGPNLCAGIDSPTVTLGAGETATVRLEFQSPEGGYTNADQGGSISPTFHVRALEDATANSAPAAP